MEVDDDEKKIVGDVHWLNRVCCGEEAYEEEESSRLRLARSLIEEKNEVGRTVWCVRSLVDLKYRIGHSERAQWVRACSEAGLKSSQLLQSEKLLDAARRLLDDVVDRDEFGKFYSVDSTDIVQALRRDSSFFASNDRLASRRRALCGFFYEARRYATAESAERAWNALRSDIAAGGPKSHDANFAVGLARICLPTNFVRCDQWEELWREWSASCCVEADSSLLTLLCRARKADSTRFADSTVRRIFSELYRRSGVPVAGSRALESTWRAWPSRYRWLAFVGGDPPQERCLRKLCKLAIFAAPKKHIFRLAKMLKPYYHPSNSGSWTPRLGIILSELCRELASVCAKRRFLSTRDEDDESTLLDESTTRDAVAALAPLARDALYSRHGAMVAAAVSSLRDLCGAHPRLVAEVCLPPLRSALLDESVLFAHQTPAALRALAALARPLLLRRKHWTIDDDSDDFLADPVRAQRAAFFDSSFPSAFNKDTHVDRAIATIPPLSSGLGHLMRAALAAVDASDESKTRCGLLFFDSMLRWLPVGDDLVEEIEGEWAPRFLERLLTTIEHRDAAAKIPNHTNLNANADARYAGVVASARDAASAELVRTVTTRLFWRLSKNGRRRAVEVVAAWIRDVPPRAASAKDAASVVAACVNADVMVASGTRNSAPSNALVDELREALKRSSSMTATRLAFTLRLMAGAARFLSVQVSTTPSFAADIDETLKVGLSYDDKAVRKASRKLLRDTLRGLLERRPVPKHGENSDHNNSGGGDRDWPDDGFDEDPVADARRVVTWVEPTEAGVKAAARLVHSFVFSPLEKLVAQKDIAKEHSSEWLRALRQLTHGIRGACAALGDDNGTNALASQFDDAFGRKGCRAILAALLVEAFDAISASPTLSLDAKIARAGLKSARALLTLRRSCHVYRARASISAIRARRRALGVDASARVEAYLRDKDENRGDDDRIERTSSHHWTRCLDAANCEARALGKHPDLGPLYDSLLSKCIDLSQHLYADVRGAALEVIDACWGFYAWALKPRLRSALKALSSTSDATSPRIMGFAAFLTSRSSARKLTADDSLSGELCEAAIDFGSIMNALPLDERDEVAERLDSVVAVYAARHCRSPKEPVRIAQLAAARANDAGSHWRHRFVAAFVATHAFGAAAFLGFLKEEDDAWRAFVLDRAVISDDEPTPRLALCALMGRVAEASGDEPLSKGLRDYFFAPDEGPARISGLLGALQREHRRERARESDDVSRQVSSPIVEALVREARHSEPWAIFPKSMAPYSSRGFRSRHARFLKRLIRMLGDDAGAVFATAAEDALMAAPATERGAACATAAETWAAAVRVDLRVDNSSFDSYFDVLRRSIRSSSPEHALCWADAVRYAAGGKAASAFRESPRLLGRLESEWESLLREPAEDATWSQSAKVLALAPSVLYELSADADAALAVASRLADALLSDAGVEHHYAAVRERVGQCLGALAGGALALETVISLDRLDEFAKTCAYHQDDDEELAARRRRRRETALAWARNAARDGELRVVARFLPCALDGLADVDEDHRAVAASTIGAAMHCARSPSHYEGLANLCDALVGNVGHSKWRARAAVAAFLGAFSARFAFVLEPDDLDRATRTLRFLTADDAAEVRDAACASLSYLVASATDQTLAEDCLRDAKEHLADPNSKSTIGAVNTLGAAVRAFPYDVPSHVPESLVVLAKHSNIAQSKNNNGHHNNTNNKRNQTAIKEAVKATFADVSCFPLVSCLTLFIPQFKRTHAETWDFIKHFFAPDQHDAFADILTTGDYLV